MRRGDANSYYSPTSFLVNASTTVLLGVLVSAVAYKYLGPAGIAVDAVCVVLILWRLFRMGVVQSEEGLLLVRFISKRFVPWGAMKGFRYESQARVGGSRWWWLGEVIILELQDGHEQQLPAILHGGRKRFLPNSTVVVPRGTNLENVAPDPVAILTGELGKHAGSQESHS